VLELRDEWVWDFWVVDDLAAAEATYHLFFLQAPRSLGDTELRHVNASVGHAVSHDLTRWTRFADALAPPLEGYDDLATWTGSVVRGDDGRWRMFTSGISRNEGGRVQRIGVSTSDDLVTWTRSEAPPLEADARWYRRRHGGGPDEHWRDPWVVRDGAGLWHMYVTAQVPGESGHGVVGHATSRDLATWQIGPPLSEATGRFDQLEVISLAEVGDRWVLVFSCLGTEMAGGEPGDGGVWAIPVEGPGAPVDVRGAVRLTNESLYVGKLVPMRDGSTRFLAFVNRGEDGRFRGGLIDPVMAVWSTGADGRLELLDLPASWRP
jgi:beta-fructofuranosidase